MNILSDTYIFYADVYFLQNFVIKIAVMYLSLYCNKCYSILFTKRGMLKIVIAAFIGTVIEILGLLFGNSYELFLLLVHLFEIPILIGFVLEERKQMFRIIIHGYFFIMLINAVLEVLWNWFGEYGNYVFWLCITCSLVYIGLRMHLSNSRMKKGIFPIEIFHLGRRISSYGFYDSGNRLMDPYSQKGVHIISEQLWKKIGLDTEKAVFVPYQALGNDEGIIKVYYVDEFLLGDEGETKKWNKCPVGVTKENLFKEGQYEIILNEEVF